MRGGSRAGFTLIEVGVAIAVGLILLATITGVVLATTQSMDQVSRTTAIDGNLSRALEVFLRDFREAALDTVAVSDADPDRDSVRFQTIGPRTGASRRVGAIDESNVFQENWSVTFLVDGAGNLFRSLRNGSGSLVAMRRIASGIDARFDGGAGFEKGFAVTRVAGTNLYDILIRMRGSYRDGAPLRREIRTTVLLRN